MKAIDNCFLFLAPGSGKCRRCQEPLMGRKTAWCSELCSDAYAENHYWQIARHAALRRDGRKCVRCGQGWAFDNPLEVNHIVPILGAHSKAGCWHHLDNLETLCREHHLEVTRIQRANGLLNRQISTKPATLQLAITDLGVSE